MKEVPLKFKIVLTDDGFYYIEFENGQRHLASVVEILLWNLLWEIRVSEHI